MARYHHIDDSEFHMWRAVFAFALVDNMLSLEEQDMLRTYYANVPFSAQQKLILRDDFENPKELESLYRKITNPKHKERFCVLARALVWCEGDMSKQEAAILKRLACLGEGEDGKIFRATRHHPDIATRHEQYAKASVAGLSKLPPRVGLRV